LFLPLLACIPEKPDGDTPAVVDSDTTPTGDSTPTPTDPTPAAGSTPTGDDSGTTETDTSPDADGDGWTVAEGDCDDANAGVNPDEREQEDGVDQDCDGQVDDGFRGLRTFIRREVVVDGSRYVSARNWVEFRNALEDVVCTFSEAVSEGPPPATMCPECTWAFGFVAGEWTQDGEMCDWIQFEWWGLDYLNYSAAKGAFDWPLGYSPTAPDEWDSDIVVYQQIWIQDGEWRQYVQNDTRTQKGFPTGPGRAHPPRGPGRESLVGRSRCRGGADVAPMGKARRPPGTSGARSAPGARGRAVLGAR